MVSVGAGLVGLRRPGIGRSLSTLGLLGCLFDGWVLIWISNTLATATFLMDRLSRWLELIEFWTSRSLFLWLIREEVVLHGLSRATIRVPRGVSLVIWLCGSLSLVQAADLVCCSWAVNLVILNLLIALRLVILRALIVRCLHLRADGLHEETGLVYVTCWCDPGSFTRLCADMSSISARVEHLLRDLVLC